MTFAPDDVLTFGGVLLGINVALAFWFLLHATSVTATALFYNKTRFPWAAIAPNTSAAKQSLLKIVFAPLSALATYVTSAITFLVGAWTYVLLGALLVVVGYALANNQQDMIAALDGAWGAVVLKAVTPVRFTANLLFLLLEIVVGLVNFVSQFTATVLLHTSKLIIDAPGFSGSFFDIFSNLAKAIAGFVTAFSSWVAKFTTLTADTLKSCDVEPCLPSLALAASTFAPLRLSAYDMYVRLTFACPAESGLLGVFVKGVLEPNATTVDQMLEDGVNAIVALPEAVVGTVVALVRNGTWVPPDVDYCVDKLLSFLVGSDGKGGLENVTVTMFYNLVDWVQKNVVRFGFGRRHLLQDPAGWQPTNVPAIFTRGLVLASDVVRFFTKLVFNLQYFFKPYSYCPYADYTLSSLSTDIKCNPCAGLPPPCRTNPTFPSPYELLDATLIVADIRALNEIIFANVGGAYPQYLLRPSVALRDFFGMPIAAWDFVAQFARRVFVGYDVRNMTRFDDAYAGYPSCMTNHSHSQASSWSSFWTSFYDSMGVFDQTVTQSYNDFASSLGEALLPYYPPLGATANLAIVHAGNFHSVVLRQLVYMTTRVLTWTPPYYMCIIDMGVPLGVLTDNLLESLPDLTTYFLDIAHANGLRNAHFNCIKYQTENFILVGASKAYYFAEMMCNARYLNGRLVTCDFSNAHDCPDYKLPFAGVESNLLCALDGLALAGVLRAVQAQRLVRQNVQKQLVEAVACIISPGNGNTKYCNLTSAISMQAVLAEAAIMGCGTWELLVRASNVAAALFSPFYFWMYPTTSTTRGGDVHASYNSQTTAFQIGKFYTRRQQDAGCANRDEVSCYQRDKELGYDGCRWDGQACVVNTFTQLSYQKFPLEAVTSVLIMGIASPVFWAEYFLYVQAERFAAVFDVSGITYANFPQKALVIAGNLMALVEADEYFMVLDNIRVVTLAVRDIIVAVLEVIRTFTFVVNRCNGGERCDALDGGFLQFEAIILDIVNIIELFIATVVGTIFQFFMQVLWIVNDMLQIITGQDVGANVADIIRRLFCPVVGGECHSDGQTGEGIMWTVLKTFETIIMQMPGIKELCPIINSIIDLLNLVMPMIGKILQPIINFFNGPIHEVCDFFDLGCPGGLPDWKYEIQNRMTCDTSGNKTNPEPTRCQRISACMGDISDDYLQATQSDRTSFCVVLRPQDCLTQTWMTTNFDFACDCSNLASHNFFCNYASGFCQEGINPFGDPVSTCPAPTAAGVTDGKAVFVDSSPYYNALCFVLPVYKCGIDQATSKRLTNLTVATRSACIEHMLLQASLGKSTSTEDYRGTAQTPTLEGPYLCRDFCSPSAFSLDNVLLDKHSSNISEASRTYLAAFGCTCAIGWNVGAGKDPPLPGDAFHVYGTKDNTYQLFGGSLTGTTQSFDFFNARPPGGAEWHLSPPRPPLPPNPASSMHLSVSLPPPLPPPPPFPPPRQHHPPPAGRHLLSGAPLATRCAALADCFAPRATCENGFATTTCLSCPLQAFMQSSQPVVCSEHGTCQCLAPPHPRDRPRPAQVDWRGASDCALIGHEYQGKANLTALEAIALNTCAQLHAAGSLVGVLAGVPTLSPRIAYDANEIARVLTHVAVGAFLGLFRVARDEHVLQKMGLDPALALPAAAVGEKFSHLIPKVTNSDVWTVYKAGKNATRFVVQHFLETLEGHYGGDIKFVLKRRHASLTEGAVAFQHAASRALFSTPNVTAASCPILTIFVNDFRGAAKQLNTHMTYDVPRSACRLVHTNGNWSNCPNASWHVWTAPPPPPPPPHAPFKPPTPPQNSTTSGGKPHYSDSLSTALFQLVHSASGYDVRHVLNGFAQRFRLRSLISNVPAVADELIDKLRCGYDSTVACHEHAGRLPFEIMRYVLVSTLIVTALRIVHFGFLSSLITPVLFLLAWPVIMNRTYRLEYACSVSLYPVVPVCLVSDVQNMLYAVTPQQIPWPSPLVNRTGPRLNASNVFDCTTIGFGSGVQELEYFARAYAPNLTQVLPTLFVSTPQGPPVLQNFYSSNRRYQNTTEIYQQCAVLYAFTMIPILMIVAAGLMFAVAVFHVLVVLAHEVFRFLKNIFLAIIAAYLAVNSGA